MNPEKLKQLQAQVANVSYIYEIFNDLSEYNFGLNNRSELVVRELRDERRKLFIERPPEMIRNCSPV